MRKKVFICSPFRGDMEGNARRAAAYSRMACEEGHLPIAPHLLFPQFLNEGIEEERRLGIAMGMELLALCDEVWVFEEATEGMAAEIAYATEQGGKLQRMSEVRAVLAEKANAGHTAEVKALIKGRGAGRLSEIDPAEYPALLAEAERL